jgi:hypothetical protein
MNRSNSKPYAAEAMRALNGMIPECLHHYGEDAAKYSLVCLSTFDQQNES